MRLKTIYRFLKQYKLFTLAIITLIVGLVLQFTGQATAAKWLISGVSLVAVLPLLWGMWDAIKSGRYGIDILAATAIITAVILGEAWAAIVVVIMLTGGESLEDYAEHRAKRELDALLKQAPTKAHVIRKGKTIDVKVNELRVGDKILIKPGELVPVDCLLIEGEANFNESSLTGESLPQNKQINAQLLSGSINLDSAVTAKATATSEDSQYQQIIKLVRGAAASQAPFVRLADRYSIPFTITAYAIGITVWVLSGDPIRFLEVIIVATPCPLILAAPIAFISGMSRASRHGIIVRNGSALEKLANAKTIAFDKTGTLTSGILKVDKIQTFGNHNKDDILSLAASLEQNSNHVLAHAIVQSAADKNLKITKAKHVKEIAGRGLETTIKGQKMLIGRLSLLEDHQVKMPSSFKAESIGQTAAYVAIGGQLAGIIMLSDQVRPESKKTLSMLYDLGIQDTLMITGDNKFTAKGIARQLGISKVYADMMPADKMHALDAVTARPLVFVGDGVNDAPALTTADVGIALGARGNTAASESADMIIMADDISKVASAFSIAKRTFSIAKQSILIGIGISVALMLAFSTGKFSPLLGAILQEVVDVVVIFNALRAHSGKFRSAS